MFLVMVALVMPVLSHAMPCNMSMPQAKVAMHHAMQQPAASADEQPCPNHKQQASKPCDGMMSVADCLDIDMMASADAVSLKILKSDMSPVAVLPTRPWEQIALTAAAPRAPPEMRHISITQPSIILTTQRFRV